MSNLTSRARRYIVKSVTEWKRVERTKPLSSIEAKKAARSFVLRAPKVPLE